MRVWVNGHQHDFDRVGTTMVSEFLRSEGLVGTKVACGEGGCGACTVVIESPLDKRHKTVNSCILPLASVADMNIITVEGLGSAEKPHPIQSRIAEYHGTQCGFCTPGFVMSAYGAVHGLQESKPSQSRMEEAIAGNLCRCTGYRPIRDALQTFCTADEAKSHCQVVDIEDAPPCCVGRARSHLKPEHTDEAVDLRPRHATPVCSESVVGQSGLECTLQQHNGISWFTPKTMEELWDLRSRMEEARVYAGSTEVSVEHRCGGRTMVSNMIDISRVPELRKIALADDGIRLGSTVTIEEILCFPHSSLYSKQPPHRLSGMTALSRQCSRFASRQVRNIATIGGNICTASPISDIIPVLVGVGARVAIRNIGGIVRELPVRDFITGYRSVDLDPRREILDSVLIPFTTEGHFIEVFKISRRKEDDIAIVSACMSGVVTDRDGGVFVQDFKCVYGGMAATVAIASSLHDKMISIDWANEGAFGSAADEIFADLRMPANAPGGMVAFRRLLSRSLLDRFRDLVLLRAQGNVACFEPEDDMTWHGSQDFEKKLWGEHGTPYPHLSALQHATGEAEYQDDVVDSKNTLHGVPLLSTQPHSRIRSLCTADAEAVPGFVGFVGADSLPQSAQESGIFFKDYVPASGSMLGLILATSREIGNICARKVKVVYESMGEPVLTIEESLEKEMFLGDTMSLSEGRPTEELEIAKSRGDAISGEVKVGGQEHFYLENNGSFAEPVDGGREIQVTSSVQTPTLTQRVVSEATGLPAHRVIVRVKRLGGGFGGKETFGPVLAAAAAVGCKLFKRPVKVALERGEDFVMTGKRHPFLGKFEAGFDRETGRIHVVRYKIFSAGGHSMDMSAGVMQRALLSLDGSYDIKHFHAEGRVTRQHTCSNTAFRGFGGPQAAMITESMIDAVAHECKLFPERIREVNMYSSKDITPAGQQLEGISLRDCFEKVKTLSSFDESLKSVKSFNQTHRDKKRGVSIVPVKFGVSFESRFLNQAGALVSIYQDGTVLVSHGGVEMGQGLHTKLAALAAKVLKVPISSVFVSETSSDKGAANAVPTAASVQTDICGGAVVDACTRLREKLDRVAHKLPPGANMRDISKKAFQERIDLTERGFYKTPFIGYDIKQGTGVPFVYFSCGAAAAEVEVDCLTGESVVRRAEIVMDCGNTVNPAIDIGQIEGAFVQGMGYYTMEELQWVRSSGRLHTTGPAYYKIPSASDIPKCFNVTLLRDNANKRTVHSGRGVGEPPLLLGLSVFFAIKKAISAFRSPQGDAAAHFLMDAPATVERIRMACTDKHVERISEVMRQETGQEGCKSWLVHNMQEY